MCVSNAVPQQGKRIVNQKKKHSPKKTFRESKKFSDAESAESNRFIPQESQGMRNALRPIS